MFEYFKNIYWEKIELDNWIVDNSGFQLLKTNKLKLSDCIITALHVLFYTGINVYA